MQRRRMKITFIRGRRFRCRWCDCQPQPRAADAFLARAACTGTRSELSFAARAKGASHQCPLCRNCQGALEHSAAVLVRRVVVAHSVIRHRCPVALFTKAALAGRRADRPRCARARTHCLAHALRATVAWGRAVAAAKLHAVAACLCACTPFTPPTILGRQLQCVTVKPERRNDRRHSSAVARCLTPCAAAHLYGMLPRCRTHAEGAAPAAAFDAAAELWLTVPPPSSDASAAATTTCSLRRASAYSGRPCAAHAQVGADVAPRLHVRLQPLPARGAKATRAAQGPLRRERAVAR